MYSRWSVTSTESMERQEVNSTTNSLDTEHEVNWLYYCTCSEKNLDEGHRPEPSWPETYYTSVTDMETNDLLKSALTDDSHKQKGDTKTCLFCGGWVLSYCFRTIRSRDHLGLGRGSKKVYQWKPYPEHIESHAQVVKELKERDEYDKIQDREVVTRSLQSGHPDDVIDVEKFCKRARTSNNGLTRPFKTTYPARVSLVQCFVCMSHRMDGFLKNVGSLIESIRMEWDQSFCRDCFDNVFKVVTLISRKQNSFVCHQMIDNSSSQTKKISCDVVMFKSVETRFVSQFPWRKGSCIRKRWSRLLSRMNSSWCGFSKETKVIRGYSSRGTRSSDSSVYHFVIILYLLI